MGQQRHQSRRLANHKKYPSDLYKNSFPITQDILDQIPAGAKKSETRFVASLFTSCTPIITWVRKRWLPIWHERRIWTTTNCSASLVSIYFTYIIE
jgi:hypothetical protein